MMDFSECNYCLYSKIFITHEFIVFQKHSGLKCMYTENFRFHCLEILISQIPSGYHNFVKRLSAMQKIVEESVPNAVQ